MEPQSHLTRVPLDDLHPTQMTVGLAEVAAKRAEWRRMKRKERERTLASHWFPAVLGPGGSLHVTDHHHLGRALHEEGVRDVWVMLLADYSTVDSSLFWKVMEFRRWVYPWDERGVRRDVEAIPKRFDRLRDDPYRSLAGSVRRAGGYAKEVEPFTEFLWADYFRPRIAAKALKPDFEGLLQSGAVAQGVALARDSAARLLPGWSGAATGDETVHAGVSTADAAQQAVRGRGRKR